MPIAPGVSSTQSRATIMQSSAKLRLTMAKAWRESQRRIAADDEADQVASPSPGTPSSPQRPAAIDHQQCRGIAADAEKPTWAKVTGRAVEMQFRPPAITAGGKAGLSASTWCRSAGIEQRHETRVTTAAMRSAFIRERRARTGPVAGATAPRHGHERRASTRASGRKPPARLRTPASPRRWRARDIAQPADDDDGEGLNTKLKPISGMPA